MRSTASRWLLGLAALALTLPRAATAQVLDDQNVLLDLPAPSSNADRWVPGYGRACRGDLFTVSVPTGERGGLDLRDMQDVVEGLGQLIDDTPTAWFTGLGARATVEVVAERVLPDGPKRDRHWLIGFTTPNLPT